MLKMVRNKIISGFMAAVMTMAHITPIMPIGAEGETSEYISEATEELVLTQQSIELYPNGEEAEQIVTLDGMMPEGAEVTVVDVSEDYAGVAAYDISIISDMGDYQPGEDEPIFVEISDPVITESIELWHIHDDGYREQIFDFTVEEGKVSFYATGFSVYEIVDVSANSGIGWFKLTSLADIATYNTGIYISSSVADSEKYHFISGGITTNVGGTSDRTGLTKTKNAYIIENGAGENGNEAKLDDNPAVPFYFEDYTISDDGKSATCYIYSLDADNITKRYVYNSADKSLNYTTDKTETANKFKIEYKNSTFSITGDSGFSNKCWNEQGGSTYGSGGTRQSFAAWSSATWLYFYGFVPIPNDPYQLKDKSYGLLYKTTGSVGYALMADTTANVTSLDSVETRDDNKLKTLYVPENSDVTFWSFENVKEDTYRLKADNGQYLAISGSSLSFSGTAEGAAVFQVKPQTDGSIYLASGSNYITYSGSAFSVSTTPTPLNFIKMSDVTGKDNITYTADRISVSDGEVACDGQQVIVYTRIWDDKEKRYDFYAIDHDGSLREVYAYGDKIMWLGDAVQTLWWRLNVYHNADGTETGYYDLQNTYSGKYFAPQLSGNQTLSDTKVGIQLPGRLYEKIANTNEQNDETTYTYNYGEYYSAIIAWDKRYYDYASLDAVVENVTTKTGSIKASSYSAADTFYFAVPDNVFADEKEATLHPVKTIDNDEYGISMKMINFGKEGGTKSTDSDITKNYFGENTGNTSGLLSTRLNEEGHPTVVKTSGSGSDFGAVFDEAVTVNHLFINSIHESSGYFEYDSCQNFATLKGGTDVHGKYDGSNVTYTYKYKDENDEEQTGTGYNFTVFRELGTRGSGDDSYTLKHGQFFPYNMITAGVYSTDNPENLYNVNARRGDTNAGLLDDSDPRKYEKLHSVGAVPDYFFGMELEAEFVQTPSGLDAWGHDIIFEFTGDDDFWLYVDGELVIDLGGIHSAEAGNVNFRTGKVNVNGTPTTLKDIFTNHYKTYPFTEEEAKAKILRVDCSNGDRNITLSEYKVLYPTEYEAAKTAYTTENPLAEDSEINSYLTKTLANRKITYDEYKELYPDEVNYASLLAGYLAQNHDDEATEYYINSIFEPNGETGDNAGYVFKDYTTHHMKIYYMERGAGASNLHMRFNLSAVTPGNVLFAKQLSGVDPKDDMDYSTMQYPFQIFWKYTDNPDEAWQPLTNKDEQNHLNVRYQNSTQTVRFAEKYTPAVEASKPVDQRHTYDNVFFLVPGRGIEISFPDNAMYYKVIECAVNTDIYDTVSATGGDGNTIQLTENEVSGNIKDLIAEATQVKEQPTIAFDNKVKDGGIRSLNITKILYNEQDDGTKQPTNRLSHKDDPTTFSYRIYLSNGVSVEMELANLQRYYVLDEENYLCKWDSDAQEFVRYQVNVKSLDELNDTEQQDVIFVEEPEIAQGSEFTAVPLDETAGFIVKDAEEYLCVYDAETAQYVRYLKGFREATTLSEEEKHKITFHTSQYGAISNIPAGYTVKVPGLIAGTRFMIEERDNEIPVGYGLMDYECGTETVNGQNMGASYEPDTEHPNIGTIKNTSDAHAIINNQRGFGIRANKVWSDSDFASGHGTIYTAVYIGDSTVPYEGSVKSIETDQTSVQYFFSSLEAGKTLADYHVYEVMLTNPVKNDDGSISYDSITKLDNDENRLENHPVTDNNGTSLTDEYMVTYMPGAPEKSIPSLEYENARTDTIKNIRKGGITVNLNVWNTTNGADTPLAGGTFRLTMKRNGLESVVGTYVSDDDGSVTVLYHFEDGDEYTIEETISPRGYLGLTQPISFKIVQTETGYSLESWKNGNDTDDDDTNTSDGKNWAEYKAPSEIMVAAIDMYNKPFTLQVVKADSKDKTKVLSDAHFELYKSVLSSIAGEIKDFHPLTGYEDLVTDASGVIPGIDQTLLPRTYYLTETQAPPNYEELSEDIAFEIKDNGEIVCDERYLERTENTVDGTLHVTFTISIPNVLSTQAYYFDIEKLILVDRYVHAEDKEQKFIFKVEHFADEAAYNLETVSSMFYVTLNCENELNNYPYSLTDNSKYEFNSETKEVEISYGDNKSYTFPAAIWQGKQTVKVSEGGIYRVSEVSSWSSTDYDFWEGSNVYTGFGTPIRQGQTDGYVIFNVDTVKADKFENETAEINGETVNRPTASFTNTETEYAYLSSQAYAENTIKRKAS